MKETQCMKEIIFAGFFFFCSLSNKDDVFCL